MRQPDRIIRLRTVLDRTGLSRSTLYRKMKEGTFPSKVNISINGRGWHEADINRWVADPARWRTANDNNFPGGRAPAMMPDDPPPERPLVAANDNVDAGDPAPETLRKVNDVVLQLARLIGRRLAREDFAALTAANDNAPKSGDEGGT